VSASGESARSGATRPDQGPLASGAPAPAAPTGAPAPAEVPTPAPSGATASRAGRNLPAAISVGVGLGALIITTLLLAPKWWIVVVATAVGLAMWELYKRLRQRGFLLPLIPMAVGGPATVLSSWWFGINGVLTGYAVTCVVVMVWCLLRNGLAGRPQNFVRDLSMALFINTWVILLASLGAALVLTEKEAAPVFVLMIGVACSDVGGYAAGVLFGKHPMVPQISPKKSWEGFAGSLLVGIIGGVLTTHLLLDESPLLGAVLGAVLVVSATLGDLIESQFKRDLGLKDMGTLLPGHGGLMDRLDSPLLSVVVMWVAIDFLGYEIIT
jgi:phosphatidate cytidylyltransferase